MDSIASDKAPAAIGPYSQAVRSGNLLFCSGQLGIDPVSGKLAPALETVPPLTRATIRDDLAAVTTRRPIGHACYLLALLAMLLGLLFRRL